MGGYNLEVRGKKGGKGKLGFRGEDNVRESKGDYRDEKCLSSFHTFLHSLSLVNVQEFFTHYYALSLLSWRDLVLCV